MQCLIYNEDNVRKEVQFVINDSGCWSVTSHHKCKDGYIKVTRNGRAWLLHRWVYTKEKGQIPDDMVVMHLCDNPSCINPEHLQIGTQLDNIDDRHTKGRNSAAYGTSNGNSKLTEEQYQMILSSPKGSTTLARELGVNESSVVSYRKRHGYKREA